MPVKKPKQIFTDLRSLFAKIGIKVIKNAFHSDNYVSGSAGWKISQSGTIEAQTLVSGAFIKVFRQAAIPTSLHIGDIWIDTDDDNKLYYADSVGADQITAGEWVLAGDFNAATWAKVTGTGKPADDATVGAVTGTNLNDESAVVLTGNDIKNIRSYTAGENITAGNAVSIANNTILIVAAKSEGGDYVTGVTYGGTPMTLVNKTVIGGGLNHYIYMFYLVNPSVGANNVVISASGSVVLEGIASAYKNIQIYSQPDASTIDSCAVCSSLDLTITTIVDNCWTILIGESGSSSLAAGTGATQRQNSGTFGLFDSNGPKTPAGNKTLGITGPINNYLAGVMASFVPNGSSSYSNSAIASTTGTSLTISFTMPSGTNCIVKSNASYGNTSNSFIGFAKESITVGNSGNVIILGEVTGLSGLTTGGLYYLSDTAGAIALTVGTVTRKVGIATSITSLLITNIW